MAAIRIALVSAIVIVIIGVNKTTVIEIIMTLIAAIITAIKGPFLWKKEITPSCQDTTLWIIRRGVEG
jgi:hypothetical protein